MALKGGLAKSEEGNQESRGVKIVRFGGMEKATMPLYLGLGCETEKRLYLDGVNKPIKYRYVAEKLPDKSSDCLTLTETNAAPRLVDTLGITQKLDREGGEAKDTVVGFIEATERKALSTGSHLGILIGQIKKWLTDLRSLAFKDKVAKADLDTGLAAELDAKVVKETGKGLSANDFDEYYKNKLDGIDDGANKYTHPASAAGAKTSGLYKITTDANGHVTGAVAVAKSDITALDIPAQDTTYGNASQSAAGFMSADDRKKLDKIGDVSISIVNGNTVRLKWGESTAGDNNVRLGYYYADLPGKWYNGLSTSTEIGGL